jgi:hypothetical protein
MQQHTAHLQELQVRVAFAHIMPLVAAPGSAAFRQISSGCAC